MGAHRWRTGARRSRAGRAAAAAVLAAVTGSVVVGVGAAAESPLDVLAAPVLPAAPAAPAAEPPLLPLPQSPAAEPERAAVPEQPTEQPAEAPDGGQQEAGISDVPPSRAPAAVPSAPVSRDGLVPGTPCTPTARACVDAVGRTAWLIENGRVVRGPVEVMVGDRQDPTPRGTFRVEWKAQQWTSREYLVEMPYSVFFAPGGIAFHQGDRSTYSGGCVKLSRHDAIAFFEYLQVGDEVQVH